MNNKKNLILYDFDGVLLDTLSAGREKYSSILVQLGRHPLTDEEFEYMKQSSPSELLTYCLSDSELVKKGMELRSKGEYLESTSVTLFDGVRETLEKLSKDNILGIVTSRDESVYDLLDKFNLNQYFSGGVISNLDYSKDEFKPHPKPLQLAIAKNDYGNKLDEVVYIGDAKTDFESAKNAGVRFIGFGKVGDEYVTHMNQLENKIFNY